MLKIQGSSDHCPFIMADCTQHNTPGFLYVKAEQVLAPTFFLTLRRPTDPHQELLLKHHIDGSLERGSVLCIIRYFCIVLFSAVFKSNPRQNKIEAMQ